MTHRQLGSILLLTFLALGRAAAAAEIEAPWPNPDDHRLQDAVERLCDLASPGDRITIRIAAGEWHEQASTTIGCKKDVSWRFVGAGVGLTRLSAKGVLSNFKVFGTEVQSTSSFSALLVCGRANPWAVHPDYRAQLHKNDVCHATFYDPNNPDKHAEDYCLAGALLAPNTPDSFSPFGTTCEVSDLSIAGELYPNGAEDPNSPTASGILAAYTNLTVRNVVAENFRHVQVGCQNCQNVTVEHVLARCRTLAPDMPRGANGVALAGNNGTWPASSTTRQNNTHIEHVDVVGCAFGIAAERQAGGTIAYNTITDSTIGVAFSGAGDIEIAHNRFVRNLVSGIALTNAHGVHIGFNHFSENRFALFFNDSKPPGSSVQSFTSPSVDVELDHNLSFDPAPGSLFIGENDPNNVFTYGPFTEPQTPEGDPAGW